MRHEHQLEVADIFRQNFEKVSALRLSRDKQRVIRAITSCRTAVLGGHISGCTNCGQQEQSYNSCWNRHCPKCQGGLAFNWVGERIKELLPVPYFHVVFTLPCELRSLCYQNKAIVYDLIFRASAETLQAVAQSRHDVQLGFFGILHSWNQELQFHPHVHHVVPAGGLTADGKWRAVGGERFFLPVRVLSKIFRGKFIELLKSAYRRSVLKFYGKQSYLENPRDFEHFISRSSTFDWVVYAKRPFAGSNAVLKYLASYTHRVAISNSRLRALNASDVAFSARDRGKRGKKRIVRLSSQEFARRFLLHLLPKSFRRIRHFGFLFNQHKRKNLALIREQLGSKVPSIQPDRHPQTCSICNQGILKLIAVVKPHRILRKLWIQHVPALNSA